MPLEFLISALVTLLVVVDPIGMRVIDVIRGAAKP